MNDQRGVICPGAETRDHAAGRLLAKLRAAAEIARLRADALDQEAEGHKAEAARFDEERTAALDEASTTRATRGGLEERITEAEQAVERAVADGWLAADLPAADAAEQAAARTGELTEQIEAAKALLFEQKEAARLVAQQARRADNVAVAAERLAESATHELDNLTPGTSSTGSAQRWPSTSI